MKKLPILKTITILIICLLWLTACDSSTNITAETTVLPEDAPVEQKSVLQTSPEQKTEDSEIRIYFPFTGSMVEYSLSLVPSKEAPGQYDLRLCDASDRIVQQFPCGTLSEPLDCFYDDLIRDSYKDLEIFSEGSQTGILVVWDWKSDQFCEDVIEIPRYDKVVGNHFMTSSEDALSNRQENRIYEVYEGAKSPEEIRRWTLQKDTGILTIWDCMEEQNIFEGKVELDEENNVINREYYDHLFWGDTYSIGNDPKTPKVSVWVASETSHMEEYPDRETFLANFGFADKSPIYQYFNVQSDLELELYLDEETGWVCGLHHWYGYTKDREKIDSPDGFALCSIRDIDWKEADPFDLKSVQGITGENQVTAYEENLEYTKDNKPDYFESKGVITWLKDGHDGEDKDSILRINFTYRDDGTLFYRSYNHNPYMFGTGCMSMYSYYDEAERMVYEYDYITHGALDFYYIYEGAGRTPKYCLRLDNMYPDMMRYR